MQSVDALIERIEQTTMTVTVGDWYGVVRELEARADEIALLETTNSEMTQRAAGAEAELADARDAIETAKNRHASDRQYHQRGFERALALIDDNRPLLEEIAKLKPGPSATMDLTIALRIPYDWIAPLLAHLGLSLPVAVEPDPAAV